MSTTTFRTNGSTAQSTNPDPGPAMGFQRFPFLNGRWRDVMRKDFLEHEITPCPYGEGYVFRLLDACPSLDEAASRKLFVWSKHTSYPAAVRASFVAAQRCWDDPDDGEGPEGEMEAAFPFYDRSTGYVEDTAIKYGLRHACVSNALRVVRVGGVV